MGECGEVNFENENRRKLEEEEEVQYFLGSYCAEQGGAIYLGLFTDDTCSTFADEFGGKQSYYQLSGEELPFGSSNIVSMDCYKFKNRRCNSITMEMITKMTTTSASSVN